MRRAAADPSNSIYQDENQKMEEELRKKVSSLKHLSISIGEEVRDQNNLLGDMNDDMGTVRGFLDSTMKRVTGIVKQGGYCSIFTRLGLFSLAVFFVMYLLIRLT